MRTTVRATAAVIAVGIVLAVPAALAEVAGRYAGQVIIFDARPPSRWANDSIFHSFVRAHRTNRVEADAEGNWHIEYMAFFRRPVDDREVQVLFYDVHDSAERYITSYSLYLSDRSQRVVGGSADLDRRDFRPNRYHRIVVTSRQQTIATLDRFALIGEEPQRSGRVDFTLEETRGP
jgi:hypothetical protein